MSQAHERYKESLRHMLPNLEAFMVPCERKTQWQITLMTKKKKKKLYVQCQSGPEGEVTSTV